VAAGGFGGYAGRRVCPRGKKEVVVSRWKGGGGRKLHACFGKIMLEENLVIFVFTRAMVEERQVISTRVDRARLCGGEREETGSPLFLGAEDVIITFR